MLGPEGTVVTKTLKIHAQGSNRKKQKYLREQTGRKESTNQWWQLMDPRGLSGEVAFDLRCEQNELVTQSIRLFVTPRTVPHQAPLSMEFSRQEYWSGLPLPSPEDLPDAGIEKG